jgi:hypothetical protein
MVQAFRSLGEYPSLAIEEYDYFVGRDCTLQITAPVLRDYQGEEKVVIPFVEQRSDETVTLYLLFEELSPENQQRLRHMFPECILISWHTVQ